MSIELRPITEDNYKQAFALTVAPEQSNFVAPNERSLAEAYLWYDMVTCSGIYAGDELVGFSMYSKAPTPSGKWIIVRFMIDHRHQGKGYGKAGMHWLLDYFKRQPECDRVYLSVVPENTAAKHLYESVGFKPTGEVHDGEEEYILIIVQPSGINSSM